MTFYSFRFADFKPNITSLLNLPWYIGISTWPPRCTTNIIVIHYDPIRTTSQTIPSKSIIMTINTRSLAGKNPTNLDSLDDFPPLGLELLGKGNKQKKTPTTVDNNHKKTRLNGTTPNKKSEENTLVVRKVNKATGEKALSKEPPMATKNPIQDHDAQSTKEKDMMELDINPTQPDVTVNDKSTTPTTDTSSEEKPPRNKAEAMASAVDSLVRKLDTTLKRSETNLTKINPEGKSSSIEGENSLKFSVGTSFKEKTVDSHVKKLPKTRNSMTPTVTKKPTAIANEPRDVAAKKTTTYAKAAEKPTTLTATAFANPPPLGIAPEPVNHLYSFVARVVISVPNCSSFQYKIMNLLAYGMNIFRQHDPQAAYLKISDKDRQAATIQELPKLTDFLKDWSYFEHSIEEFKNFRLDAGKTKKYRGSVLIGCNVEPKTLLEDTFLDLDNDLDDNLGGGKITFEYKKMQSVDTDRNWILFGVPSKTHPESFGDLLKPFLFDCLIKMRDKNPDKYSSKKYHKNIPEFVINIMYVQNVLFEMTKGLPAFAKICIHIEIKQSDKEFFQELFRFIGLAKLEKKRFGQFARFYYAPPPGSMMSAKEQLGFMLQNHVAIIRSLGKIALPGILLPDKKFTFQMKPDSDGDPRKPVHMSLRRMLMTQRIGRPRVWQCILPNASGGWDGYYANGHGCEEHRVQALLWAGCIPAHVRFYLLRKGVEVQCVTDFINQCFTVDAAADALNARLIKGEVFTASAASAVTMRNDIESSGWVDVLLGQNTTSTTVLSRPKIALRINEDLSAHNFSIDRNPEIAETDSVAYSTSGDTTLGDGNFTVAEEDDEEIEIIDHARDDATLSTTGSGDSNIWDQKQAASIGNKEPSQENMESEEMHVDAATPYHPPATITTTASTTHTDQLSDLLEQIAILQGKNDKLMAAVAKSTATTSGSHPSNPQSNKLDAGTGGGGDY